MISRSGSLKDPKGKDPKVHGEPGGQWSGYVGLWETCLVSGAGLGGSLVSVSSQESC